MTTLQNKVAIITGSSRGIGAAIAARLVSDGYAVITNMLRQCRSCGRSGGQD